MAVIKCKMCGGALDIQEGQSVAVCEYCGVKQTLPRLDNEHKAALYDRANHFRRNNEFDKAMAIYEQILSEDSMDAELYWSLVLCKYGIEYVEDPDSLKRIPTVNRAQFVPVLADEDYQMALKCADTSQRILYEKEAKVIDDIHKEILKISSWEEPYDIFICYKESDERGGRTVDSVLAQDIYYQLIDNNYKVFFSRITLESKVGQQYEPYIFSALNSAKVMIVIGTRPEYFNAVWVKNEWSRYVKIAKMERNRLIIPAYKDMDPYDLPEGLSYYQAMDMSKIGFIQDLLRGIKKVLGKAEPMEEKRVSLSGNFIDMEQLYKNAETYRSLDDWDRMNRVCLNMIEMHPDDYRGWWGLIQAATHDFQTVDNYDAIKSQVEDYYDKSLKLCNPLKRDDLENQYDEYEKKVYEYKNRIKEEKRRAEEKKRQEETEKKVQKELEEKARREAELEALKLQQKMQEEEKKRENMALSISVTVSVIYLLIFFSIIKPYMLVSDGSFTYESVIFIGVGIVCLILSFIDSFAGVVWSPLFSIIVVAVSWLNYVGWGVGKYGFIMMVFHAILYIIIFVVFAGVGSGVGAIIGAIMGGNARKRT